MAENFLIFRTVAIYIVENKRQIVVPEKGPFLRQNAACKAVDVATILRTILAAFVVVSKCTKRARVRTIFFFFIIIAVESNFSVTLCTLTTSSLLYTIL